MSFVTLNPIIYIVMSMIFAYTVAILVFKLEKYVGQGLIYSYLGVLQIVSTLAAAFLYHNIGGLLFSIGSIALFPTILSIILMLYITHGAKEAKNGAYVVIISNGIMVLYFIIVVFGMDMPNTVNFYDIPSSLFISNVRTSVSGTLVTIIDILLIVFLYEYIKLKVQYKGNMAIFIPIFFSLFVTLLFDAVTFTALAFYGTLYYTDIVYAHIIGKSFAALIFSVLIYVYYKIQTKIIGSRQ